MRTQQKYALLNDRLVAERLLSLLFAREAGSFQKMSRVSVDKREDPKEVIKTLLEEARGRDIVHGYEATQIEERLSHFRKLEDGSEKSSIALVQGSRNTVLIISHSELSRASLL